MSAKLTMVFYVHSVHSTNFNLIGPTIMSSCPEDSREESRDGDGGVTKAGVVYVEKNWEAKDQMSPSWTS